jgi:hypothetical protein
VGLAFVALTLAPLVPACRPDRPACGPEALAAIEARYVADALAARPGETFDTCPELPGIREGFRAERQAWVRCEP